MKRIVDLQAFFAAFSLLIVVGKGGVGKMMVLVVLARVVVSCGLFVFVLVVDVGINFGTLLGVAVFLDDIEVMIVMGFGIIDVGIMGDCGLGAGFIWVWVVIVLVALGEYLD